jgi:hypothetical protein
MKMKDLHRKFERTFENGVGQTFTRQQIKAILLEAYPDFKDGSVLPNDHGKGNVNPCRCSGTEAQIFDTLDSQTGPLYKVRNFATLA